MAKMGRPPKPTALRLLSETPETKRKRHTFDDIQPDSAIPKTPKILTGEARKEWNRVTKQLHQYGLISELDVQVLVTYCVAVQMRKSMYSIIQKAEIETEDGQTLTGEAAYFYGRNSQTCPEYKAMTQANEQISKIASMFGMTPCSRVGMRITKPEEPSELEKMIAEANRGN